MIRKDDKIMTFEPGGTVVVRHLKILNRST